MNWQAYRISRRRLTPAEQAFSTKMIIRWLPTGHRTAKYGGLVTGCHRCGEDETVDHLFQCSHQLEWKQSFLERLTKFLTDIDTAADVRRAISKARAPR